MDQGQAPRDNFASAQGLEGVAEEASTRVGEILAEAEQQGGALLEEADEAAAQRRREAEAEIEGIAAEAREAVRAAARERAARLAALQEALTVRGPALLEGLEGEGLTRARLEALIEALGATADRVTAAAEEADPHGAAEAAEPAEGSDPDATDVEDSDPESGTKGSDPIADPAPEAGEPEDDPVAAAEDLARAVEGAADEDDAGEPGGAFTNGDGNGSGPVRYEGPLPEGVPMARQPARTPERDARFAALLLAVEGRERGDVEAHLRSEHDVEDCESILDEVFGETTA